MRTAVMCMALVAAGLSPVALAQNQSDPTLSLRAQPTPRIAPASAGVTSLGPITPQGAWGTGTQGMTWIAPQDFSGKLNGTQGDLDYRSDGFYSSPAGTSDRNQYYAQLDIDVGKKVSHVSCLYRDSSPTEDISFAWYKYETDAQTTVTTVTAVTGGATSSGTPGGGFMQLVGPALIHNREPSTDSLIHYQLVVRVGDETSFSGCMAYWNRQVAPGPATATFNDVPTTSPFFKFVEALNSSGVTAGCGNGNFCPNAPVTRGQMAVYLAEALGMGYPY